MTKVLDVMQMGLFRQEEAEQAPTERAKSSMEKDIERLLNKLALPAPQTIMHEKILPLQALEGVTIELVGEWYWISGETKKHKDTIKTTGARYSAKRKKWYYYEGIETARRGRSSKKSYEEIKEAYGYVSLKDEE